VLKSRICLHIIIFLFCGFFQVSAQQARDVASLYEQGREAMFNEDWYSATEAFLECLRRNPAHTEATRSLAEAYYELGEYDEAWTWVRKARALARLNSETVNLEASILTAMGRLNEAESVIRELLAREPYNRSAVFTAAELDIARGRSGEAVTRYKNAINRFGDDRRLLVSLALVLGSLGDMNGASMYIERAQSEHPDDYRVPFFAAYIGSRSGKISEAIRNAERCLSLRPGYAPARNLLASLRYRSGDYPEAIKLANEAISANRKNTSAWFLKGMSQWRQGRMSEARSTLSMAQGIDAEDEFIRAAYEELLISDTPVESAERRNQANYHFTRGADFRKRNLTNESLFEYRRGLRINPYADDRREYAELLRLQGYPALQLEELKFMVDQGKGTRQINDAIETWTNRLSTSLTRQWPVNPEEINPHWGIVIFSVAGQSAMEHTDAGFIAASYLRDILNHSRKIKVQNYELREASFASAFRVARETGIGGGEKCDYFLLTSVSEHERDLSLKAELFVARTGAKAAEWTVFRAGQDRLRNAALNVTAKMEAALPFRSVLLRRNADRGLIDKGKADGVIAETVYNVIKKGKLELLSSGIGFNYLPDDVVGTLTISNADEEISMGKLARQGFFDLISAGDEVVAQSPANGSNSNSNSKTAAPPATVYVADPELRSLLMTLRD
jgi:tetratricopeptide (TPR) repeat protein